MRCLKVAYFVYVIVVASSCVAQSVLLNPTTTQTVTQPKNTSLDVNVLNQVVYAHVQPGIDAGAKIQTCIDALPPNGGTCDARGFGGTTQYISTPILLCAKDSNGNCLPASNKAITLLIDPATQFNITISNGGSAPAIIMAHKTAILGIGSGAPANLANFVLTGSVSAVIANHDPAGGTAHIKLSNFSVATSGANCTAGASCASLIDFQAVTDLSSLQDLVLFNFPKIGLHVRNGTNGAGSGPIAFRNLTVNGTSAAGARPIVIEGQGTSGLISGLAFHTVTVNREGSGHPLIEINGNGIANGGVITGVIFEGVYAELGVTGDDWVQITDAHNIVLSELTCGTGGAASGTNCIKLSGQTIGISLFGVTCQQPCTNTVNDVPASITANAAVVPVYVSNGAFVGTGGGTPYPSYIADLHAVGAAFTLPTATFAQLPTTSAVNGMVLYCTDCTMTNPTGGGGTGAVVKRINGSWLGN